MHQIALIIVSIIIALLLLLASPCATALVPDMHWISTTVTPTALGEAKGFRCACANDSAVFFGSWLSTPARIVTVRAADNSVAGTTELANGQYLKACSTDALRHYAFFSSYRTGNAKMFKFDMRTQRSVGPAKTAPFAFAYDSVTTSSSSAGDNYVYVVFKVSDNGLAVCRVSMTSLQFVSYNTGSVGNNARKIVATPRYLIVGAGDTSAHATVARFNKSFVDGLPDTVRLQNGEEKLMASAIENETSSAVVFFFSDKYIIKVGISPFSRLSRATAPFGDIAVAIVPPLIENGNGNGNGNGNNNINSSFVYLVRDGTSDGAVAQLQFRGADDLAPVKTLSLPTPDIECGVAVNATQMFVGVRDATTVNDPGESVKISLSLLCSNEGHCSKRASSVSGFAHNGTCRCTCKGFYSGDACETCPVRFDAAGGCNSCSPKHDQSTFPSCSLLCTSANCSYHSVSVSGNVQGGCSCSCRSLWQGPRCDVCPAGASAANDCTMTTATTTTTTTEPTELGRVSATAAGVPGESDVTFVCGVTRPQLDVVFFATDHRDDGARIVEFRAADNVRLSAAVVPDLSTGTTACTVRGDFGFFVSRQRSFVKMDLRTSPTTQVGAALALTSSAAAAATATADARSCASDDTFVFVLLSASSATTSSAIAVVAQQNMNQSATIPLSAVANASVIFTSSSHIVVTTFCGEKKFFFLKNLKRSFASNLWRFFRE